MVWVDSGESSSDDESERDIDYLVVYQGSSVGFTVADLLRNDSDPQGQTLTVVAVEQPGQQAVLTGDFVSGFTTQLLRSRRS